MALGVPERPDAAGDPGFVLDHHHLVDGVDRGAAATAAVELDDGIDAATTASTGTDEVAIGSAGWGIKILRGLLRLADSPTFDAATESAVRQFQTDNGLVTDGRVGPQTWAALRRVTAPADRPTLRRSSTGDPVMWVQRRLGCASDGDFGPRTEAHVRSLQQARSLVADGIVGPQTWTSLTA